MALGHHAAVGRSHRGVSLGGRRLAAPGLRGGELRLGRQVIRFRLVQRRRAHEFLLHQPLRALVLRIGIAQRRLGLGNLGLARGVGLVDLGGVDTHDHLALLHPVTDIEIHRNHAAGNLRRHGRLLHRLDHAFGGIGLRHLAILHRSGTQRRGSGSRDRRGQHAGQR